MLVAGIVLISLAIYTACGLAVGIPFVVRGVDRVDSAARGAPVGFRLLILPGVIALWPLMATKWRDAIRRGETQ